MVTKDTRSGKTAPEFKADVIFQNGGSISLTFDTDARLQTFAGAYKKYLKDGVPKYSDAKVQSVAQKIEEGVTIYFPVVSAVHYLSKWR